MLFLMKTWNRIHKKWKRHTTGHLISNFSQKRYRPDKDGYCTCRTCQGQKKIEQIKKDSLPDDLFEL